jgi:hypothetical protein
MSEVDKLVEETNRKIQDRKRQGRPATTNAEQLKAEKKKYFDMVFGEDPIPLKTPEDAGKYCVYHSQGPAKRGRGRGRPAGRGRGADAFDADLDVLFGT